MLIGRLRVRGSGHSIQRRIRTSFCLLICLALLATGLVTYTVVRRQAERDAIASSAQALDLISRNINAVLASVNNACKLILSNNEVRAFCAQAPAISEYQHIRAQSELGGSFFSQLLRANMLIGGVGVYPIEGPALCYGQLSTREAQGFRESTLFEAALRARVDVWYRASTIQSGIGAERSIVSMTRRVLDRDNRTPIGVVELWMDESVIRDSFAGAGRADAGGLLLMNARGERMMADPEDGMDHLMPLGEIQPDEYLGGAVRNVAGTPLLITCVTLDNGWVLAHYQAVSALGNTSRALGLAILALGVLTMLIASFVTSSLARQILGPMHRALDDIAQGTVAPSAPIGSSDEIVRLFDNYRQMLGRIQQAELDALRAQITPHFLYNTLNSIRMRALIDGQHSIAQMTRWLSDLLHLTINSDDDFIPLAQEFEIMKSYVGLQQMCSDNRFTLEAVLDDEALGECLVPKMCLQSLAENAILHGFEGMERPGLLRVEAGKQAGLLAVRVIDDGVGMDAQTIGRIRDGLSGMGRRRFSRIGIHHVDQRIKACYGEAYGIAIWSEPGRGSVFTITMPAIQASEGAAN